MEGFERRFYTRMQNFTSNRRQLARAHRLYIDAQTNTIPRTDRQSARTPQCSDFASIDYRPQTMC